MAIANPILNFVVRGLQALFGIVVLGISVSLIRGHHWGGLPASLGFAASVGGVTILGAAIGVMAMFVSFLDGVVGLAIDGVIAIVNVAGGILLALKLSGVNCTEATQDNFEKLVGNTIINGGCRAKGDCWYFYNENNPETMISRCKSTQADDVFMFLTVAVLAVSGLLAFLRMKKGY
ncbi:hypothetical protein EJ02DRAFT_449925 [Clathrospora elynae]|uniref:MARVEL domain-containing protein n=1 Tax=Clathrospora elynae TaxID=706981 RepID=A0A6A5TEK2_9PLEO|nr:hypothetical protein EJ02DRAFT_449925 [Clathrospora elynae]